MSSAHVQSPEVFRKFRAQFSKFDNDCRSALAAVNSDVRQVHEWLRREQQAHWKREFRRREELVQQARLEYLRAIQGDKYHGKITGVDERKALERAIRAKDEAMEKIEKVKRWCWMLDQKAGKLLQPCSSFSSHLEHITPQALGRLDRMMDRLDEYLRPSGEPTEQGKT